MGRIELMETSRNLTEIIGKPVRFEGAARRDQHIRKFRKGPDKLDLFSCGKKANICFLRNFLIGKFKEARDARVSILKIIDRIFLGLGLREIEIEIKRAFLPAHGKEKSSCINANIFIEFTQGHKLSRPCRHTDRLAFPVKSRKLNDSDMDCFWRIAKSLASRFQSRNIPMVVRPPQINHQAETAFVLGKMIGHIRRKISVFPGRLSDYTVFIVSKIGRAEPERPFTLIKVSLFIKHIERVLYGTFRVEAFFAEIIIKMDPHFREIGFDLTHEDLHGIIPAEFDRLILGFFEKVVFFLFFYDGTCDVADIFTFVPVFRKRHGHPEKFVIAGPNAFPKKLHLASRVIKIIFRMDLMPRCLENPYQSIAYRSLPPVSNRKRPGRIRAHEFYDDLLPFSELGPAITLVCFMNINNNRAKVGFFEMKVDKSSTRDIHAINRRVFAFFFDMGHDRFSNLGRFFTKDF